MQNCKTRFPRRFRNRLDLSRHATPRLLQRTPIDNWFIFPHSYSHGLVEEILKTWGLGRNDRVFDPFVGAGTTLAVARGYGIPAVGLDLSPLAVFVTNAKLRACSPDELEGAWHFLASRLPRKPADADAPLPPRILARALSPVAWAWIRVFQDRLRSLKPGPTREILRLALLRAMREVCGAKSDGGWIRWTRRPSGRNFQAIMASIVAKMVGDLRTSVATPRQPGQWYAILGDARVPTKGLGKFSAVISSPPYPNRHDYTRVFAPELLLEFLDEEGLRTLRYALFRSHVEARAPRLDAEGFVPPPLLQRTLRRLLAAPVTDRRVIPMIEGYFRDAFLTLSALRASLRKGARLAFVVGNVRHAGVMVEVDRILAWVAEDAGYRHDETWVIRLRGNSAQQMGTFGRETARESVVFLRR